MGILPVSLPEGENTSRIQPSCLTPIFTGQRGTDVLQGPCRGIRSHSQACCHGHKHVPRRFGDHDPQATLSRSQQALRLRSDAFNWF